MAAALHHVSMLPTIKCSSCGTEIEISMVGEHSCTDKQSSTETVETPILQPPAPFAPPKHTSPLQQVISQDDDARSRSPSPVFDESSKPSRPKPPPIDLTATNNMHKPTEPLTPADSFTAPDFSPVSSSSGGRSSPFLEPPRPEDIPQPLTPRSGRTSPNQSRPSSQDLFQSRPPVTRNPSSSSLHGQRRPRSPLSQHSSTLSPDPQSNASVPPPLRVNIPTHSRQTSGSSILATPIERHRKSPSIDKAKRQSSNGAEEKKILGLFRRKSSRSVSKRNVSSPIIGPHDKVPAMPGVPISAFQNNIPPTPITPSAMTPGFDSVGKTLPSGPAPPRPARPESIHDLVDHMKTSGVSFPTKATSPTNKSPTAPALPPPPQPFMPQVEVDESRGRYAEWQKPQRNSDASIYTDINVSPERHTQSTSGLPQISEEEDAPTSIADRNPPPSAFPGDRLRASNGSRHAPSESVSSTGSRMGFDERSLSSISSPPTSSVSSFQFKDTADDTRALAGAGPESASSSPKIGVSPRTANFSRPRAPTLNSFPPFGQGATPSPLLGGPATAAESPSEPATPGEKSLEPLNPAPPVVVQQPLPQQQRQPPTLQPVSYQRQPPSSKPLPQPFVRPPLPPTPEEPTRPTLSRSKSTTWRGQCRGCRQEITGRSVKAADGRLTGRWHRECFVCRTCRSPFQTADFYVLRDEPYCSHHYHVLNNSLCRYCHTGIEGRYFEIDGRRRFHTGCFACAECRRPLAGDYFEMGNRFYCEIDAQRFHSRTTHLNPGRRFPERRTTKLMEM